MIDFQQVIDRRPECESSLGFPIYQEHWEAWAVAQGLSGRHLSFVLCDGSRTTHVGHWRFQPKNIRLGEQQGRWLLTAGRTGFCIGLVYGLVLTSEETLPKLGLEWPPWVEGDSCLIGQAMLYQ